MHYRQTTESGRWIFSLAAGIALIATGAAGQTNPAVAGTNQPPPSALQSINGPSQPEGGPAAQGADLPGGFWTRLNNGFLQELGEPAYAPPASNSPAPQHRGLPTPFDSPPYPTGEWQIGGTPIIGDPNENPTYPLMKALYDGPQGQFWKDSRVQIYGWVDVSGNVSSSHNNTTVSPATGTAQAANFPESYDERPNRAELDQLVLFIERMPDEFQTDHLDWGFRASALYGLDYRYTTMKGVLSDQLLKHNRFMGLDFPMVYADLYIPWVAQGMNIRVGRIISEPDIEAQLAPNNPMSSHSLLYTFDPYTQIGIFPSVKLNDQWTVQAGLSGGNDVAPWVNDSGRQITGGAMIQWTSKNNKDSIYFGDNVINNGNYGYNNIQQVVGTWSHKFNEKVWTTTESWYMWQHHVPASALPAGVNPGYAPEVAVVNYTMFRLSPNAYLSIRNEVFNDIKGQRTGTATPYTEHAIGITWWPDKLLTVRPELRYEHSYDRRAYDTGTRKNQFTAAMDVIFHF